MELACEVGDDETRDAPDWAFDPVFGRSSAKSDVATAKRLRAELAASRRKPAEGSDPADLRRLRVKIRSLERALG